MSTVNTSSVPAANTRSKDESKVSDLNETKTDVSTGSSYGSPADQLVALIKTEHTMVKQLYATYQTLSNRDEKLATGRRIIELIAEHANKEEVALYPVFRKIPSLGDSEVEKAKAEHLQVAKDLYALNKMSAADAEYDALISKMMNELTEHVLEEETRILPLFARGCPKDQAAKILSDYQTAKVTDQPHPSAPHEGFAARLANMASIPLDQAAKAMRSDKSK